MDGEDTGRTIPRRSLLRGAARGAAAIVTASAFGPTVSLLGRRAAAQEATQVRLTGAPSSPEESRLLEQVLQDFEAKFPDITVVWEPVTQQYAEKLQTDLAAGTAADVFYVDSLLAPDLAARGVLLPLDEPMAGAGVRAEDFYAGLIEAFQWQGKTYGLPKDWSSLAMVYDPQAFDGAGIVGPADDVGRAAIGRAGAVGRDRSGADHPPARFCPLHRLPLPGRRRGHRR